MAEQRAEGPIHRRRVVRRHVASPAQRPHNKGQANQCAMAKAIASGNPRLMHNAGFEADISCPARTAALRASGNDQERCRHRLADTMRHLASYRTREGWLLYLFGRAGRQAAATQRDGTFAGPECQGHQYGRRTGGLSHLPSALRAINLVCRTARSYLMMD